MKFAIKDFFSKCEQIRSFLWIWSHLLKKSLMEKFIFRALRHAEKILKIHRKRPFWNLKAFFCEVNSEVLANLQNEYFHGTFLDYFRTTNLQNI